MTTKTITVTEEAYFAMKSLKESKESFSDTFLRLAKRKPLSAFIGILSKESADIMRKTIMENRKRGIELSEKRREKIIARFS